MKTGVHHLGLATLDLDRTVEFWTKKLDCKVAWADVLEPASGGKIKHVFMDTGDGTLIAFMCPEKVPEFPKSGQPTSTAHRICPGHFTISPSTATISSSSKPNVNCCSSAAST